MLSPEEEDRIIERLHFESKVRDELLKEAKPSNEDSGSQWFDNKLVLLLIGSLITGFLVPVFQYTQETFKWRRQNNYEAYKYNIDKMRDALTQAIGLQSYLAQAYSLCDAASGTKKGQRLPESFRSQFLDIQKQRFQQNARISSLFYFYPDGQRLSSLFANYNMAADQLMKLLHDPLTFAANAEAIDKETMLINSKYEALVTEMNAQIQGRENDAVRWF